MVLKRVLKSTSPHPGHKQKKPRVEDTSEFLAVSLKSLPSVSTRFDQPDHSSTPVSTKAERLAHSTISPADRANGNHSTAPSMQAEVPKLMIKLKPILPKATQSGFPFIFTNSDSDHSQPVIWLMVTLKYTRFHFFVFTRSGAGALPPPVQNRIRSALTSKVQCVLLSLQLCVQYAHSAVSNQIRLGKILFAWLSFK